MVDAHSSSSRVWWIPSVFGITVGIVLFSTTYLISIKADDIWWHLKTGEYIFENLHIPVHNMFSFTAPDHAWVPQEWLSQVFFYIIYEQLGSQGLIFTGIVLNAIACGFVYKLTVRYSNSPYISIVITLLAALMMLGQYSLRPYLFGNLFFVSTLYVMDKTTAGGRMRPILVFMLFSGWANFHGSFLIGLALIVIYLVASLTILLRHRCGDSKMVKSYFIDFLLALFGSMATPNHVFGLIFPLNYLENALSTEVTYLTNMSEWQPASLATPLGQMVFFYLLFCVFAMVGSGKAPKTVHIGLLVAFATFAFSSIRNIPLLGMVATLVLARHLPLALQRTWRVMVRKKNLVDFLERFHQRLVRIDRSSNALVLPVLSLLVLLAMFLLPPSCSISYTSLAGVEELHDLSQEFYPKDLIHRLQKPGSHQRIFNYFNWGGAMIWGLYPRSRVFIDQRSNCYPIDVFLDYFAVHHLKKGWLDILDRWHIDVVAYPAGSQLVKTLKELPAWTVKYEDNRAVLFERSAF